MFFSNTFESHKPLPTRYPKLDDAITRRADHFLVQERPIADGSGMVHLRLAHHHQNIARTLPTSDEKVHRRGAPGLAAAVAPASRFGVVLIPFDVAIKAMEEAVKTPALVTQCLLDKPLPLRMN